LGQVDNAKEWMERAMLIDADNLDMRYNFACVLAAFLDDKTGALRLLERNFATVGAHQVRIAETDPDLDSLRSDPRFQKILSGAKKRLGMGEEIASKPPAADSAKLRDAAASALPTR
jgi:adenylate cyclase